MKRFVASRYFIQNIQIKVEKQETTKIEKIK